MVSETCSWNTKRAEQLALDLGRDLVSIGKISMKTSVSRTFFWEKPPGKASPLSENGWNRDGSLNITPADSVNAAAEIFVRPDKIKGVLWE
jgi:hypothetical protein